ncbi:MAG: N-6 DNA methylase [Fibromonadaceae bacterium]|jgi:type I restriction-modification system DNA methylase subunit|nr:N-6 DNA methylase [Fibromonadaceae bacterium]
MSEELLQRNLLKNPEKIGKWDFYNIGSTSIKDLKNNGILRNVDYGEIEKKKVDALIVFKKKVIAIIEYKKPSEFNTKDKQNKAIQQEIDVAKRIGCKLIIATDTQETVWVNAFTGKQVKDENNRILKANFDPHDEHIRILIEKINYSINEVSNNIKPKQFVNPTDLAKRIWQDIWSVSGATPENCLYTFVELFIFKYLSDLGVLQGIYSFDTLIASFETNDENEILENYANIIRPKIKDLFPMNPIDKTTIINGTIFVSKDQKAVTGYSTVFKKVLLKFKNYGKLENIDYDFKSKLFESFLKESISKKNWGQFFTPLKVVRAIIEMAKDDIKPKMSICDPACGVGKFLLEPIVTRLDYFYRIKKDEKTKKDIIEPKITIHGFDKGFDKDEQKTIILAKANMLIYFSDLIKENPTLTKEFADLFNKSFTLKTNSILGTLSDAVVEEYDLIITNPPYVTSGSSNLKEEIKKDARGLNTHYKINALGVEGLFMEWIIKALKPDGKAFVVIPDGMLNRLNDKNLRRYILEECFLDALISLPLNSFFTTNKKTYIMCITKKVNKNQIQTEPVFSYLVNEIGETRDVYRFDIDQNDLDEAVTLYSFFKGNKDKFENINSDKRCKIIPIKYFIKNFENDWLVDKLWTENEKVELGIIEKNESLSLFEFSSIVDEISDSLKEFSREGKELSEKKKSNELTAIFSLKDIFSLEKGLAKYTRKYGNQNKGEYPVFSASNNEPLTYINTFDYDGEYLTWATNGFAGYTKIITGKFSINGDRGLMKPKIDNIYFPYIKYKIEPILRNLAKGRKGEKGQDEFTKVYPSMVENIEISMPVDNYGNLDILAQIEIAQKHEFIDDVKKKINEYQKQIVDIKISFDSMYRFESVKIKDIFDLVKGKQLYTRDYIRKHKGNIPVYSSQTTNDGIIGYVDKFNLDCNALTWTTDGVYAGTVFIRTGKFCMTTHCGALVLKKGIDNINLEYIYWYLKNNLKNYAKSEQNKRVTVDIIKNISVPIPLADNEEIFNINIQEEIANKNKKIELIKNNVMDELEKIKKISISSYI